MCNRERRREREREREERESERERERDRNSTIFLKEVAKKLFIFSVPLPVADDGKEEILL